MNAYCVTMEHIKTGYFAAVRLNADSKAEATRKVVEVFGADWRHVHTDP